MSIITAAVFKNYNEACGDCMEIGELIGYNGIDADGVEVGSSNYCDSYYGD